MKESGRNKTEQRKKSQYDVRDETPASPVGGALERTLSVNIASLGQKWLGLYTLPHLVRDCRLPWERCDLGWCRFLQWRQTLRELSAGGCVLTRLPKSGPQSFLKGGLGSASPYLLQAVIFLF